MKRKILAALLLAFIAIVLALGMTHFSFREMMSTVNQLSSPNQKLIMLNRVFEEITMLDQQQRAEAIQNPQKPYKYFLDQTGYIDLMIDSLKMLDWDSVQARRLNAMPDVLDERNQTFVSYLKVKAELADNKEFSNQLDTLSLLLLESQHQADSSVITTEKKTITTYFPYDTTKTVNDDRTFLKKLFSKKKKAPETTQVKVQEETNVTIDTLTIAKQSLDMTNIQKRMRELERDQRSQRKKLQAKELELIHANSVFINQLLNTLHEVENEELQNIRINNNQAAQVVTKGISRMSILMVSFFLAAAFLVYLILIDISRSNYYKAQLEKAKNEAEELSKIKQRFLANMSHEIRTPLQSIIGFAEHLKQGKTDHGEAVEAIHSSSEHLLQIVNEVLDYSRISSGTLTMAKEKFKLLTVVREVESAMRIQAERKKLTFISDSEKASEFNLVGDAFRLRQILYNLLGNAIKFTQQGYIKLAVKTFEETEHVNCVFEITDTGIGIAEADLNKIFNQFEQANSNITRNYGGTGLGLTIVKSLVDAQQGNLEVKSEPGAGSTFRVRLKFEKAIASPLKHERKNTQDVYSNFTGKAIIVDDDAMILKLCSLILKKNNIQHNTFPEAQKALDHPVDHLVTHIFLDIRMPVISGVELCHELKAKYPSRTRFIALTAHVLPEEKENLLKEGFDAVLTKPFHESELLHTLGVMSSTEKVVAEVPDFSVIRQMTLGDDVLFQSVISQFVEETSDDINKLREALPQHNKKAVREIVHKMAGRFGQMGVYSLSGRLHQIEVNIVDGKSVNDLSGEIQSVSEAVSELLNNVRLTTIEHLN